MSEHRTDTGPTYTIYVIEIMPLWHELVAPDLPEGKRCFYVGQTSHDVSVRYREHLTGTSAGGRKPKTTVRALKPIFKAKGSVPLQRNHDVTLRRTMMADYPQLTELSEAEALESKVVDDLRALGHCVYPKKLGSIEFQAYKQCD